MKRAATDGALSDEGKEAFDLVEPGGIGGREVNVPTRTACEPSSDLRMLVGGVVVDDEMDVELGWHVGLDVTREGEEFLMAMAGFALGDDRAVKHVESGEQRGCGPGGDGCLNRLPAGCGPKGIPHWFQHVNRVDLTKPAKPPPMAGRKQEVLQLQE